MPLSLCASLEPRRRVEEAAGGRVGCPPGMGIPNSRVGGDAVVFVSQLLARRVADTMTTERELFNFGRGDGAALLLIVDRREDPVTPLLTQWTYQAMVHELIGIDKNTVDLSAAPGIHADLKCVGGGSPCIDTTDKSSQGQQCRRCDTHCAVCFTFSPSRKVVLAPSLDSFFNDHQFANYGELGSQVQRIADAFAEERRAHESIKSIGRAWVGVWVGVVAPPG